MSKVLGHSGAISINPPFLLVPETRNSGARRKTEGSRTPSGSLVAVLRGSGLGFRVWGFRASSGLGIQAFA